MQHSVSETTCTTYVHRHRHRYTHGSIDFTYTQQENVATFNLVSQSWLVLTKWISTPPFAHTFISTTVLGSTRNSKYPENPLEKTLWCLLLVCTSLDLLVIKPNTLWVLLLHLPWLKIFLLFVNDERTIVFMPCHHIFIPKYRHTSSLCMVI